jgi:predicted SnoaL-like aldol condensation-catalyzing enzyme
MSKTIEETNKALVLEAFDTLFNKRDYKAAERYWSPNYIQHGRPRNWIAADVVRIADGMLAEHRDVQQDEATNAESQSGRPMFGTEFPA